MRKKVELSKERIYELREKGLSCQEIADIFLTEEGIKISYTTIRDRCREIYKEKGQEEPKLKRGPKSGSVCVRKNISITEIYKLREKGLGYKRISKYYKSKGINISTMTIMRRCKEIYEAKGEPEPEPEIRGGRVKKGALRELEEYLTKLEDNKEESEALLAKYEELLRQKRKNTHSTGEER